MSRDLRERRRQLDAVRGAFAPGLPVPTDLAPAVGASWRRCADQVPSRRTAPVEADDVEARWVDSPLRQAATGIVDELADLAVAEDYVAAITDERGCILWSASGAEMARRAERAHFVAGSTWDEGVAGTNAPGLALLTEAPATVFASEHWCEPVHDWVCYAAPIHDAAGRLHGVLDLSAVWRRASPLALSTVTAMARLIGQQLSLAPVPLAPTAPLELRVLGQPAASLRGAPLHLTLRQLEILTILAVRGGVGLDELHALLYGDRPVSATTLKAEISHLRQRLGADAIGSRPYRFTVETDVDVVVALDAVRRDDLAGVLSTYRGQLLVDSESPFVTELRHRLDVGVRTALLGRGDADQLLAYADVHPFDLEVLEVAIERARPGTVRHGELLARLAHAAR